MSLAKWSVYIVVLALCVSALGCARAAEDTRGFSMTESATVQASFADTWQAVKSVLRERDLNIYTRDKRGLFIAYSDMHRVFFAVPRRVKHTIVITPLGERECQVEIETVRQVYGVTLLTLPNWHDRKVTDNQEAVDILSDVVAKLNTAE